ncbi:MAG: ATP-dependent helicase RecG, partial [Acidobacteriota bacterium]|nr:ATP-dependent helicase RecG [Acidobacteriota bacterium]
KLLGLFINHDSLGNQHIRELLNLKDKKSIREFYIGPALEIGAIEYAIPDKPNSPLQKYRLTSLGREILKKINPISGLPKTFD